MPTSVQPVEVLWSVIAVCGLWFSTQALLDARRSRRAARSRPDGATHIFVDGLRVTETVRWSALAGFLFVGIAAMFLPTPPAREFHGATAIVQVLVLVILIYAECALTFAAYWSRRTLRRARAERWKG